MSERERKQTLLTGFGPFGSVQSNPTERLLTHFSNEEVPGHELTRLLLPVSYRRAPEMMREALQKGGRDGRPFDYILMLGVAGGSPHWRVERFGRNYRESVADMDGFAPPSPVIDLYAPEAIPSTLPVPSLVLALEQIGLPVIASETAGGYLCNHLLFTTLRHLPQSGSRAQAGFLHVPADEQTFAPEQAGQPQFPFEQHIHAVRAVLNALAAA